MSLAKALAKAGEERRVRRGVRDVPLEHATLSASTQRTQLTYRASLAAMVAFLFSEDGAYVNGQTILVVA